MDLHQLLGVPGQEDTAAMQWCQARYSPLTFAPARNPWAPTFLLEVRVQRIWTMSSSDLGFDYDACALQGCEMAVEVYE